MSRHSTRSLTPSRQLLAYTVDTAIKGAIFKAFHELETPALFNCTSNCTWDRTYTSLGFSIACADVTEETYNTRKCVTDLYGTGTCNLTTPGNITFSTAEADTMWSTVLVIEAASPYDFEAYALLVTQPVPTNFMRFVVLRQPSDYMTHDDTVEETLECDLSFAAYRYSTATSVGNTFAFGHVEAVVLDPKSFVHEGTNNEQSHLVFNTSGLPEFRVSMWDLGALLQFYPPDSFSGTLAVGEIFTSIFLRPGRYHSCRLEAYK